MPGSEAVQAAPGYCHRAHEWAWGRLHVSWRHGLEKGQRVQVTSAAQLTQELHSPALDGKGVVLLDIAGQLSNDFPMSHYSTDMTDGRCAHACHAHCPPA